MILLSPEVQIYEGLHYLSSRREKSDFVSCELGNKGAEQPAQRHSLISTLFFAQCIVYYPNLSRATFQYVARQAGLNHT